MGKTMRQFFSAFSKEKLCQLYIYPTIPDVDFCNSYYRITDKDVLKSYFRFGKVNSRKIEKTEISSENTSMFEAQKDEALYRSRKNKKPSRLLLRNLMWRFANWYNKDLKQWLQEERPECIFVAPGTGTFLYTMALKISKRLQIPIAVYLCDDYYFLQQPKGLLAVIEWSNLRRAIRKLLLHSAAAITICDDLTEKLREEFTLPVTTIMTGASIPAAEPQPSEMPNDVTYMGNIRCDRYSSLIEFGKALDRFNQENGTEHSLKIYTAEKNEGILSALSAVPTIRLCGFVAGSEAERVFQAADYLLHVESFDPVSIDKVKYSVSTKIADSLSSGKCLLAYAPAQVASMRHLLINQCAVTATKAEELDTLIHSAFDTGKDQSQIVRRAIETAKKYHDSKRNSEKLKMILEQV